MGAIDVQQLRFALTRHRQTGRLLGRCLIDLDVVAADTINEALQIQSRPSPDTKWRELIREVALS